MKAAIYLREPIDDIITKQKLINKAEKYEWDYSVFTDKINARKTRPVKVRLLNKLRNKEFEVLIIDSFSTWANTSTELIREIAELTNKGIILLSVQEKLKFSGAYLDMQNNILRAFNMFEQNKLNEKASAAIKKSISKGKKPGRPKGAKDMKKRKTSGYSKKKITKLS
ncbi:MAG TPA: recombinase family protein [Ignavibacteriaceae bacterium]|nr:recombinase family protein [Ignavibacteriaceae bacterium]